MSGGEGGGVIVRRISQPDGQGLVSVATGSRGGALGKDCEHCILSVTTPTSRPVLLLTMLPFV